MADEHKAWLDGATAEELLCGRAAGPVGPGADPRARAEAARLRAALDALAPPTADRGELPGEAAALAAFRAAHATRAAAAARVAGAGLPDEPLVDLAPIPVVRIPAQRRHGTHARFGLAAALAGVAVGGIAAVAGTGLLDRDARLTAGPAPAVSISADSERTSAGETAGPSPLPQLRPTPEGGGLASLPPGFSVPPDGLARTPLVPAPSLSLPPGTVTTPGTQGGGTTGTDGGTHNTFTDKNDGTKDGGGDNGGKDRDQQVKNRPDTLCRDHAANRLGEDRKQYLAKIAGGVAKISRFCANVLEAPRSGTPQSGTADQGGGVVLPTPIVSPAGPLGFRTR
ncbi:hypothetical protein ABZ766_12360 [Streptomyces sp. NPDC006670]|uniref:hypothetical protein n=1 Tax=Streptomyces sp. NPDC006670 TaxID=3154476 RepID=UPI0033F84E4F